MRFPTTLLAAVAATAVVAVLPALAEDGKALPPRVRDSWVRVQPPPGFSPSAMGFERKEEVFEGLEMTVAAVWVMPLTKGFGHAESKLEEFIEERRKTQRTKEKSRREVAFEGAEGIEVELELDRSSSMTVLIVGDEQRSVIVTAYAVGDRRKTYAPAFRKMLDGLVWDPPEDTLPFVLGKSRKLTERRVVHGSLIVRRPRKKKDESRPGTLSLTVTPVDASGPPPTSEVLLGSLELEDLTLGEAEPVTIGSLKGERRVGIGVAGRKLAVVHWLLRAEGHRLSVVAVCPSKELNRWRPEFEKLVGSLRAAKPANGK